MTRWLVPMLLLLPVAGCASIKVTHQRNVRVDFSVYRTFNWSRETGSPTGNPRLDNPAWSAAVIETANRTLIAKGLKFDLVNVPQLWFTFRFAIERKARIHDSLLSGKKTEPGGGREYYSGRSMGDQTRRVEEYEIGSLTIEAVDAASGQMIWRGAAEAVVKPSASMAKKVSRIREATQKVMSKFPRK